MDVVYPRLQAKGNAAFSKTIGNAEGPLLTGSAGSEEIRIDKIDLVYLTILPA